MIRENEIFHISDPWCSSFLRSWTVPEPPPPTPPVRPSLICFGRNSVPGIYFFSDGEIKTKTTDKKPTNQQQ